VDRTGITWGFKPEDAARAIPDVASLGYRGYETFGEYLEAWELKGGLDRLLDANQLPLVSAYGNCEPDRSGKTAGRSRQNRRLGEADSEVRRGYSRDWSQRREAFHLRFQSE
jgi:hypothetical protein